ncbi:hypothetical protein LEMLEM_LOCUS638, partial [Lemmus lemmus]
MILNKMILQSRHQSVLKSLEGLPATERPSLRRAGSPLFCLPWIY